MSKQFVLAEKPSVGREIGRVLGCNIKKDGYLEGKQYVVSWALGHLVELAEPQEYDARYETWNMEDLPMLPKYMKTKVIPKTSKQFKLVKTLMQRKDINEIIIATDAGREGELVARWIIEKANVQKPLKRLWISSQTDKAIKDGFAHLKDAKDYENLYYSAKCRAEADWLVGLNTTRALTCKYNAQLSAGRVQTPTLAMIVDKEEEIRKFVPKEYFTIHINTGNFTLEYRNQANNAIYDKQKAEQIQHELRNQAVTIVNVETKAGKELPPQLYDLTELQRDANLRYGFSAKETLNYMQDLYEIHKVLTYPRTDSRYLSSDIVPTLKDRLKAIAIDEYEPYVQSILKKDIRISKRVVDDTKVSDHHAIIPTEEFVELDKMSGNERKIYDLVVRRFLAVLSDTCEYEKTRIHAKCKNHDFYANGKVWKKLGWRELYQKQKLIEEENDDQNLPVLKKNLTYFIQDVVLQTHYTKAPARYTEASLLSAMEHPSKFIKNAKMKSVLEDANGIGTVATRADIIEKLFSSHYIEKRGNYIYPLSKGIQLVSLVPEELRSALLTAKWEEKLALISKGKLKSSKFIKEMQQYASQLVDDVKSSEASYRHDNMTQKLCPECGSHLLDVNGKKGKMLVCSNPGCRYKQQVSYISNARCPNCHKKLTVVGEKDKKLYTCVCGFREKFDRMNEKLKEKRNVAGKRDLRNYNKKQEAELKQEKSAFQLAWEEAQKNK